MNDDIAILPKDKIRLDEKIKRLESELNLTLQSIIE
jgi:hypothetical protein